MAHLILRCRWRAAAWPEGRGSFLRSPSRRGCRRAPLRCLARAAARIGGCDPRTGPGGRWPRTATPPKRPGTSTAAGTLPVGCCPSGGGCSRSVSTRSISAGSWLRPCTIRRIVFLRTPPPLAYQNDTFTIFNCHWFEDTTQMKSTWI